jgi:hypothetical protein
MTVLVRQNTAGTTALNGTAPDPTNTPGNNWYSSNPTQFVRSASGGVLIPNAAYSTGLLTYNFATVRQKITINTASIQDATAYIRLQINGDAQGSTLYGTGTGYTVVILPGSALQLYSWNGGSIVGVGSPSASALPSAPFTVSSAYLEHLVSGTLNCAVTISGTTYSVTGTVGSPLTGTYAGLYSASQATGGISAAEIVMEDNAVVSTIYEFASLNRGIGRGIARGIA